MHPAACQKQSGVGEEYKTGIAKIPGVLNSTKENLQVYVVGDPNSRLEVVIFRGLNPS